MGAQALSSNVTALRRAPRALRPGMAAAVGDLQELRKRKATVTAAKDKPVVAQAPLARVPFHADVRFLRVGLLLAPPQASAPRTQLAWLVHKPCALMPAAVAKFPA